MVTLYRLVLTQTARIQTLETVASELAARVYKLERSLTTKGSEEKYANGTNEVAQGKAMNKVSCMILKTCKNKSDIYTSKLYICFNMNECKAH